MRAHRLTAIALAAILGLAAALRLIGVRYGLPAVYNPDEVAIMSRSLAFATGDLNPHNFLYPTFYLYVLFGWIGASFLVGWVAGAYESLAAFRDLFFVDPSNVYFAGRLLSVVCGVATVGATYLLGRGLFDRATGVAAALFLAVSPFHVRDSHYVKHDVPVTLAVVVAYLAMTCIWPGRGPAHRRGPESRGVRLQPDLASVALAAVAVGVAFSTHYYTLFLAVPLALAIWFRYSKEGRRGVTRRLLLAVFVSAGTFFALSPFILVEPATAWRDIAANRQIVIDRALDTGGGPFVSAGAYARMLMGGAMGWPVALLAIAGGIWLTLRAPRLSVLLAAFPLAFLLFISNTVAATRYLNPVLPYVALLAGYAIARMAGLKTRPPDEEGARVAETRPPDESATGVVAAGAAAAGGSAAGGRVFRRAAPAVVAILAAIPALVASVQTGLFFRRDDTRTLAERYIEQRVPPDTTVLVQPYSVPLAQSGQSLREALTLHLGDPAKASIKFQLRLAAEAHTTPAYRTIFLGTGGLDVDKVYVEYDKVGGARGLEPLDRLGVEYVVLKRYNRPEPETLPFLDVLAREGRRIAVFSPYRPSVTAEVAATVEPFLHNTDARIDEALERPGPVIELWRVK